MFFNIVKNDLKNQYCQTQLGIHTYPLKALTLVAACAISAAGVVAGIAA